MSRNERGDQAGGLLFALLKALGISLGVLIVLTALTALGISAEILPEMAFAVAPYIIAAFSAAAGGLFAARWYGAKPVPIGALYGLVYTVLLYLVGLVLPNVSFSPPAFFTLLALNIVFGALGALPAANTRKRKY